MSNVTCRILRFVELLLLLIIKKLNSKELYIKESDNFIFTIVNMRIHIMIYAQILKLRKILP